MIDAKSGQPVDGHLRQIKTGKRYLGYVEVRVWFLIREMAMKNFLKCKNSELI
jgi:hypothetical protein